MATFQTLNPILQALLATLFTWSLAALGAANVFVTKTISPRLLNGMLGFAAAVLIAASYWSFLAPSIEMAEGQGVAGWIPAAVGFLLGGAFLWTVDKILPHLHLGMPIDQAEGLKTTWKRNVLRPAPSPWQSVLGCGISQRASPSLCPFGERGYLEAKASSKASCRPS